MTHLEQLEELVKDEDKIVTVPDFALLKKISVEESQKAVNQLLEANQELHKTYILSGIRKSTGVHSVVIVNEKTLSAEKKQFENPQQLVFSVQKGKNIDYNIVFQASLDNCSLKDAIPGSIVGKNCIKRKLIKNIIPASSDNATKATKPSASSKDSSVTKTIPLSEERKDGSEKPISNESKKSNNIVNMFNKAAQNKKVEPKSLSTNQKPKQQGGLQNFFTKQPSKVSQPVKKEAIETPNESVIIGSDSEEQVMDDLRMQVDVQVKAEKEISKVKKESPISPPKKKQKTSQINLNKKSDLFDSDTDEEIMKDLKMQQAETKKTSNSTGKKSKRKPPQKKNQTPSDKKRKRIVVAEDSDSDIFKSDEDNDILEDLKHPEEEPAEEAKPPPAPPGKAKRRKAVKRTYEDDEGFIVTQTEYVYETASEDENIPNSKISKKETPKPKLEKNNSSETDASPKGGTNKKTPKKPAANQPTLMSFLK